MTKVQNIVHNKKTTPELDFLFYLNLVVNENHVFKSSAALSK